MSPDQSTSDNRATVAGTSLDNSHPAAANGVRSKPVPILERILARKRTRVESAQKALPERVLRERAQRRPKRDFAGALQSSAPGVAVIAELKKASPSKGLLRNDFDVEKIAQAYASAGAAALSVLTEEDFFLGLPDHLTRVANSTTLPVLRKDFIYSSYQIWEAAGLGADAVLLIVAMLSDGELRDLLQVAADAGVAALTEVHNRAELRHALTHGAKIVGVNNRDLRDFSVNVNLALELIDDIPEGVLAVAESGLQTAADLERMAKAGYDAVLIGEHFMKAPDPGAALAELLRNTHALRK